MNWRCCGSTANASPRTGRCCCAPPAASLVTECSRIKTSFTSAPHAGPVAMQEPPWPFPVRTRSHDRRHRREAMTDGIVVVGDLFRPDGSGRPGGTDRTTRWLWNAIKRPIYLATGLATDLLTASTSPALHEWIGTLRTPAAADPFWASSYTGMPASAELDRHVLDRLRRRFCIGYEMPPWLIRLLDEHALPYVDIRLHPVRFMDDLMFAVRASQPATQAALLALAVMETEVIVTAGLREAM